MNVHNQQSYLVPRCERAGGGGWLLCQPTAPLFPIADTVFFCSRHRRRPDFLLARYSGASAEVSRGRAAPAGPTPQGRAAGPRPP
eukprot:4448830-Prymnesium_polylepis.1